MRLLFLLVSTTALAACGGAGPQTAGSAPPPGSTTGTGTTGTTSATNPHSFVDPSKVVTYSGIGAAQHLQYSTEWQEGIATTNLMQGNQLYNSNASTARDSAVSITYDPRSAEFTFKYNDTSASIANNTTFQDPLHRTDFGGALQPQEGVDDFSNTAGTNSNAYRLAAVRYLQTGSGTGGVTVTDRLGFANGLQPDDKKTGSSDTTTFFYQKPGTTTKYVTFAGYVRNQLNYSVTERDVDTGMVDASGNPIKRKVKSQTNKYSLERGAFVFGERTASNEIPTTGSGTYIGPMVATMIFNDQADTNPLAADYFQWIQGQATTSVNFRDSTFTLALIGATNAPQLDLDTSGFFSIPGGATFQASGNGVIDFVRYGGFEGRFTAASFTTPGTSIVLDQTYLSGSSINGAFFGPAAAEVGGGFRMVSGVPDQRVDIMGSFTGAK